MTKALALSIALDHLNAALEKSVGPVALGGPLRQTVDVAKKPKKVGGPQEMGGPTRQTMAVKDKRPKNLAAVNRPGFKGTAPKTGGRVEV